MDKMERDNTPTQFSVEELEQRLEMTAPSDGEIIISPEPIVGGPHPSELRGWWF